jgi:hypothetical protein
VKIKYENYEGIQEQIKEAEEKCSIRDMQTLMLAQLNLNVAAILDILIHDHKNEIEEVNNGEI